MSQISDTAAAEAASAAADDKEDAEPSNPSLAETAHTADSNHVTVFSNQLTQAVCVHVFEMQFCLPCGFNSS